MSSAIADWEAGGLLKPSVIKPVIATIERTLVIKRLGRLSLGDGKALVEGLRKIVD